MRRYLLSALVVGGVGAIVGSAVSAAFVAQTSVDANAFSAGTVVMADSDAGLALFTLTGLTPASPAVARCVRVTYSGSLAADVRLYATHAFTPANGDLGPQLQLTVERGTESAPASACTTFVANTTVYSGLLSAYPTTWATGRVDPTAGSPETWTNAEAHSYRITLAPRAGTTGALFQGRDVNETFRWEARNQ